jgi:hypothetical protein
MTTTTRRTDIITRAGATTGIGVIGTGDIAGIGAIVATTAIMGTAGIIAGTADAGGRIARFL